MAIRRKKDSSIVVALNLVKEGKADAFLSAGSTGAIALQVCSFLDCPNDGWNLDLYAYQNSGSAQTITWYLQLIKLK